MSKILEADSLISSAKQRAKEYIALEEQMDHLDKQIQAIVNNGSFTGKGAQAIKSFYSEQSSCIQEWKKLIQMKIAFLNTIEDTLAGNNLADATVNGILLENSLPNGLRNAQSLVDSQKRDLDSIFNEIDDILPLTSFSTDTFDQQIHLAEKKKNDTLQALNHSDSQLTNEYAKSEELEQFVKSYFEKLTGATNGAKGINPMSFNPRAFHQSDLFKQKIEVNKNADDYLKIKKEQAEKKRAAGIEKLKKELLNPFHSKEEYIAIADKIGYENLSATEKLDYNFYKFNLGAENGMRDAFTDLGNDLYNLVTNPMDSVNGFVNAALHPVDTVTYLAIAIKDSFMKDVVNGDSESRGHWVGYVTGTILPAVLTEGATGVGKTALGAAKAGTQAAVRKGIHYTTRAIGKGNELLSPYGTRYALSGVNEGTFNVVDIDSIIERDIQNAKIRNPERTYRNSEELQNENYYKNVEPNRISDEDRERFAGWRFPPKEEKYLKYKEIYDNPKYYHQETGAINWPKNDGFEGEPVKMVITKGDYIDRYGGPSGEFFSPAGVEYDKRALALHSDEEVYYVYRVKEDFELIGGKAAPWFDRPGGGTQFLRYDDLGKRQTIEEMIEDKLIEEILSVDKGELRWKK